MQKFLPPDLIPQKLVKWISILDAVGAVGHSFQNACLLVLDMQKEFLTEAGQLPVWGGPAAIRGVQRLISLFEERELPIIYTRHICIEPLKHHEQLGFMKSAKAPLNVLRAGTEAVDFHQVSPRSTDTILEKYRYSAFFGTPLETLLRVSNVNCVIITGVATNICCETTAHDAFFRGFTPITVLDATGGTSESAHLAALANLIASYGPVCTAAQIEAALQVK